MGCKVHPVFHVSLLKKKISESSFSCDLPPITDEGEVLKEPETILYVCWTKRVPKIVEENLVKWKNLPDDDATWENAVELKKQFNHIKLEDKVLVARRGIDRLRRSHRDVRRPTQFDD